MNWLYIITLLLGYWCHHMVETNTLANTLEQRRDELNCEPVDDCSCSMKDGSSISLWPIDDPDEPRFQNITDLRVNSTFRYEYSPCSPFTEHKYHCKDVLVCQRDSIPSKHGQVFQEIIGKPGTFSTAFVNYAGKQHLSFRYNGNGNRHARIILNCDEKASKPELTSANETITVAGSVYTFVLTSKHACLTGKPQPPPIDYFSRKVIVMLTICVAVLLTFQFVVCTVLGTIWCRYFKPSKQMFQPKKLSEATSY